MNTMVGEFQLVAGHLALDFANTLDNRYESARRTELLSSYGRFVAFAHQSGILNAGQAQALLRRTKPAAAARALRQAIELREALHSLFVAVARHRHPPRACLRTLNRFLAATRAPHVIVSTKHDFVLRQDVAATPDGPLAPIMEAAAALLASPDRALVRECTAATCRWLFLDRSKNHTRRWCDMRICGNRAKARRFQTRHVTRSPAPAC